MIDDHGHLLGEPIVILGGDLGKRGCAFVCECVAIGHDGGAVGQGRLRYEQIDGEHALGALLNLDDLLG